MNWLSLLLLLLLVTPAFGQSTANQTINTIPSSNTTFLTDLQNFLRFEDANRFAQQFNGFVVSGGTHSTGSGLTQAPAALTAYPGGQYVTESNVVTYSNNATCWVIADKNIVGSSGNFSRVAGTHYLTDCVDALQPALPTNTVWLMKVVTSGGAVTAVTDLRNLVPYSFKTTLAQLPSAGTPGRLFFVTDVSGGLYYFDNGSTIQPFTVNVMTAVGDLIVGGTGGTPTRLAVGSNGKILQAFGGTPLWATVQAGTGTTITNTSGLITIGAGQALTQVFRGLYLRTHPDSDKQANKVQLVNLDGVLFDGGSLESVKLSGLTADVTVSGVGGLDTGSRTASTWYEIYTIRNGVGVAPATPPTAADSGLGGNVNVGTHSWKITCFNTQGESIPSTASSVVNLGTAHQVNLSAIATCDTANAGFNATGRKIYRTVAGDTGSYLLVGTLSDNTTTTFVDNVADGSLGVAAPATGTFVTKALLLHRAKDFFTDSGQNFTTADDAVRNLRIATATPTDKLAQGFQSTTSGAAGPIDFVDAKLIRTGAVTGNIWFTIEADSSGSPSGTALATSDKADASKFPTAATVVRFAFRTPFTAVASTQYHLVLQGDYTRSDTVFIGWRGVAAGGYASGSAKEFNGASWGAASGVGDFTFKVYTRRNDAAVTMPSGYTEKTLLGYVYNNSGNVFKSFVQVGQKVMSGMKDADWNAGPTLTNVSFLLDLSPFLPPVPIIARLNAGSNATGGSFAAGPHFAYDVLILPTAPVEWAHSGIGPAGTDTPQIPLDQLFLEYQSAMVVANTIRHVWVEGWNYQ